MSDKNAGCLVLGAAIGYKPQQVENFLKSLRCCGYKGDISLLVEQADMDTFRQSGFCEDVELIAGRQWIPFRYHLLSGRRKLIYFALWCPLMILMWFAMHVFRVGSKLFPGLEVGQKKLAYLLYPPTQTRYFHYLDLLEKRNYQRVLISDVRDVIFQKNPFQTLPENGLAFGFENDSYTLGEEEFNSSWILRGYGEKVLKKVADKTVICSGVTYGDRSALLKYLKIMQSEICNLPLKAVSIGGMDQGIHNVAAWCGHFGPYEMLRPMHGALATLNGFALGEINIEEGSLVNVDGSIVSILHQYDRVDGLDKQLKILQKIN